MTTEVRYEVELVEVEPQLYPGYTFPKIVRIILADGTEVSRGYPNFAEVKSASPQTIEAFFDEVSTYFRELSTWLDTQTDFDAEQYKKMAFLNMFLIYYGSNFDMNSIESALGPLF